MLDDHTLLNIIIYFLDELYLRLLLLTCMEIKHNIFLKYDPYFKHYSFISNFELRCKILIKEHISDGRYDYFGDRVETMRHGTYGIMLSISKDRVISIY